MNHIPLPALDGHTALGVLAALGLLRLLDTDPDHPTRLSWSPTDHTAVLHTHLHTIDDIAAALRTIVDRIPDGAAIPDLPDDFPPRGEAPDRLRLHPPALRQLVETTWPSTHPGIDAWLTSLVTDTTRDDKGRSAISLFTAPSGKQSMRTMLDKPLAAVRANPQVLHEALAGWRRYPGVTGEYLDHHVIYDGADAADGRSRERGVPGATWLALMAYPLLRTTTDGAGPITTGWHRTRTGRTSRLTLVLPLWTPPLRTPDITALIDHPALTPGADTATITPAMRALGIFAVTRSRRRRLPGRTFAGVLAPAP